jgi:ATP phosphoribosyltransferase
MSGPPLTIALPKGRVFEESVALLARAGLPLALPSSSRALRHQQGELALLELRNTDVPIYVDLGVADLGVVGKDILLESGREVYEPLDLGFARCRIALIRPRGAEGPVARVATKYPRFTRSYLEAKGMTAEVIYLSGNIELAAVTGLADAVVDIVQTGETLRANDLCEVEVIAPSSARLIVARASLKLKRQAIRPLIHRLAQLTAATAAAELGVLGYPMDPGRS